MLGNKFSKQLTTSKRQRMTEAHVSTPMGGWNPNASDSARPLADFAQLRNMRKMNADSIETRSGYKQWRWKCPPVETIPPTTTAYLPKIPLGQCEYRYNDNFVTVAIYAEAAYTGGPFTIYALILHRALEPTSGEIISAAEYDLNIDMTNPTTMQANPVAQVVKIVECSALSTTLDAASGRAEFPIPVVAVRQYQTFVVVSIVDDAEADLSKGDYVFGIFPTEKTLSNWIVLPIGKEVCPTPSAFTFSPEITGPLLAYIPTGHTDTAGTISGGISITVRALNGLEVTPNRFTGAQEWATSSLDIKAPYYLADADTTPPSPGGGFLNFPEPQWRRNKKDPVAGDVAGLDHLMSRGWQYQFRFKRKFNDVRGNEIIVASSPSADVYVEDRTYTPPIMTADTSANPTLPAGIQVDFDESGGHFSFNGEVALFNGSFPAGPLLPNVAAYELLRSQFKSYRSGRMIEEPSDPLWFVAAALGWAGHNSNWYAWYRPLDTGPDQLTVAPSPGWPPYKLDATSYDISQAPNVIFDATDFAALPTGTYAIDIYRTAYCYPNPKDSDTAGTGYSPYVYGYVGTINVTGAGRGKDIFIDNIQDTAILFEQSPLQSEGYLAGQFSGEVMRQYQTHMVLGNTREKYWLKTPWSGMQAINFVVQDNTAYDPGYFAPAGNDFAPDGLPWVQWYYAYCNTNKKLSDAIAISMPSVTISDHANGYLKFAFVFPRGYSTSIDSVLLIQSRWINPTLSLTGATHGGAMTLTDAHANFDSSLVGSTITLEAAGITYTGTVTGFTDAHTISISVTIPALSGVTYYIGVLGARHYYKEAYVGVADGTYISSSFTAPGLGEITVAPNADGILPLKDISLSTDPGFIIWTKPGDLWSWPPENISDLHDQDPVTALDEVIGPLYVYSDKGEVMTRDDADGAFGYVEPVHTSGTGAGSISRLATCKVGQIVFSLCSNGLIYTGGAGVVPFPATIESEITKRLREKFKNRPALYGVRNRVSMGYLPNRSELWITFPSTMESDEYGFNRDSNDDPGLPARTFVIKFMGEKDGVFAYEFEIAGSTDFEGPYPNPTSIVIHTTHADGSLISAYYDKGNPTFANPDKARVPALVIQDNDRPELPWPGYGVVQWQNALGVPNVMKMLFSVRLSAVVQCDLFLGRGMLRTDSIDDARTGTLWPTTPLRQIAIQGTGERAEYHIPFGGLLTETAGTPPAIRLVTKTNSNGDHFMDLEQMDVYWGPMHQHKP